VIAPAVLTDQWDKGTATVVFFTVTGLGSDYSYQTLCITGRTDRHDQPAADFQLHG
jgi:hypothetical protein